MNALMTKMKVLAVDDNRTNLHILQVFLKKLGHDVILAENGEEAVARFQSESPDLVLLDIMMPVMDGIALALAVARDYPNLSILLMTGFADQRERAFGLDSLVSDVVSKPFTLAEVRAVVARALVGRSATEKIA